MKSRRLWCFGTRLAQHGDPRRRLQRSGQDGPSVAASRLSPRSARHRFWKKLDDRFHVVVQPFSGPNSRRHRVYMDRWRPPRQSTRIWSAWYWFPTATGTQVCRRLRLRRFCGLAGVPVLGVPVGKPVRLPDIELRSLDAPTFAVLGKSVRIPFTVESSLPRDYVATVVLRTSGGDEVSKEVRISRPWASRTTGSPGSRRRWATKR